MSDDVRVVRRPRGVKAAGSGSDGGGSDGTQKRGWVRRSVLIGASVIGVVALIAGATVAWGLWSLNSVNRLDLELTEAQDDKPSNFLLIGSDSRENVDESGKGSGVMNGSGSPEGRRADSIAIVRVDKANERLDMLSIPRDLWLPIGETDKNQRINTAYAKSTQTLIDTIQRGLGIPINHTVEVDFRSFQDIIESVGGVPVWFDHPVRDKNSGLQLDKGCANLDGFQGLAFARSRHLEWKNGSKWVADPTGDLGRMTRQQILTRAALTKVRGMGLDDIPKLKGIVDAALGNVQLDSNMGNGDMIDLARQFSDFDPQRLQTHSLAVTPHTTDGGAAVVLLDPAASAPVIGLYTGATSTPPTVTTTTLPPPEPSDVIVSVYNATPKQGEARRVSFVLGEGGFGAGAVETSPATETQTVITYPKDGKAMAELIAPWMTPVPKLELDKALPPGNVRVTIGSDFKKISEPTGVASAQVTATTPTTAPSSTAAAGSTPTTTAAPEVGWTPGSPPAGVACG